MERVEIHVPERLWPKKDPTKDCPCQKREMVLKRKQGTLKWLKQPGDAVRVGEPICEAEVEIKVVADSKTGQILGFHMYGPYADELLCLGSFIIEQKSTVEQVKAMAFPHPTVGEYIQEAVNKV